MTIRAILLLAWLPVLALPDPAGAQGIVGGARAGAARGERAAGPVGGLVGGVVGGAASGVVGGLRGVFGIPRPLRAARAGHRRRHR